MTNYGSGLSYAQNKKLNNGVRELIADFDGDYFVTAVFNRNVSLFEAGRSLEHWYNCLSAKVYTKKWYKLPASERFQYIAVPEHMLSNIHWHMVVKLCDRLKGWKFEIIAGELWKKYNTSGSMDVRALHTALDKEKVGCYVTKDAWQAPIYKNIKFST